MSNPRILFWDVETAPIVGFFWNLHQEPKSYQNISQDWFLISAAWKFSDENRVSSVSIKKPHDDKHVAKTLSDVISQADIIVHHNGDKFDLKALNTRLIYHGYDPLPRVGTVDTLKELDKIARFSSHSLGYLSQLLFKDNKLETDFEWWKVTALGSLKYVKAIEKYNRYDVVLLEKLYYKLRPFMKTHPHIGALMNKHRHLSCPKCGSGEFKFNGVRVTAAGMRRRECKCKRCHGYFQVPENN